MGHPQDRGSRQSARGDLNAPGEDLNIAVPTFTCDFGEPGAPLRHVWEHTVGSGHAALALRADWQQHLRQCHRDLGFRHVRFHGILSHPMDTLICQDNAWMYSFFDADQIIDALLSIGVRPFVELSFMPEALASGRKTVFHYRANVTRPSDYRQWAEVIRRLVAHWIDRYGAREVGSWFFEVWNEPNLTAFGSGRRQDYFTLYRATVQAIKSVDPTLQVGGPATAKSAWIDDFVAFVDAHGLPADFISTHQYPTDAFGSPGDDTETQLAKSQRGVMKEKAQTARRHANGRPLYYTEWSTSSNPRDRLHDDPFAAAFAINIILSVAGVVDGYSWWTCSDIFNENYMPSTPFQGGFGLLNIHGIPKPVYRAFELLYRLGTEQLVVDGLHDTVSAWVVRRDQESATVLLTNHALPRHDIATERATIVLTGAPQPTQVTVERIDERHANATQVWRDLGEPEYPAPAQIEQLQAASRLVPEPMTFTYVDGRLRIELDLAPHAVAAVTIQTAAAS